jgi:hypothetical protein
MLIVYYLIPLPVARYAELQNVPSALLTPMYYTNMRL